MVGTIRVLYSCTVCGLVDVGVVVPERGDEDVVVWINGAVGHVAVDHRARSPQCHAKAVDLKVPFDGRSKIGGPVVN